MSAYEDVASGNGVVDSIGVVPAVADVVIAGSGKHTSNKQVKVLAILIRELHFIMQVKFNMKNKPSVIVVCPRQLTFCSSIFD